MKKHSLATVFVVAVAATTASASVSIGYVAEQSGNTWSLGNDTYVGLMGFKQTAQGQTITAADILGDINAPGRVIGLGTRSRPQVPNPGPSRRKLRRCARVNGLPAVRVPADFDNFALEVVAGDASVRAHALGSERLEG